MIATREWFEDTPHQRSRWNWVTRGQSWPVTHALFPRAWTTMQDAIIAFLHSIVSVCSCSAEVNRHVC